MKRKLLALTLCAGLALGLTACGSSDPGQKLWAPGCAGTTTWTPF